jgi:hypothetical protein
MTAYTPANLHAWFTGLRNLPHVYCYMLCGAGFQPAAPAFVPAFFFNRVFKGVVVIAESSSGDTLEGFSNYKYAEVVPEYKRLNIKLLDLNREQKYEVFTIVDTNIRPTPVRLATQLLWP